MMTVPIDSASIPSPWEHVQALLQKNAELESSLRKSAQKKVPSDPGIWFQIRENYVAIVLADYELSEKHEIEFQLWQLHYKKIEEFRARIKSASSNGPVSSSQVGNNHSQPDKIKRIKSAFITFLSESVGFYHDFILKIKSKYALALEYFSEYSENSVYPVNDKITPEMKKGLFSCHRCLIYLGDLSRYKGLYGEGDLVALEYDAASRYYRQAASLVPSSGNPHHQLAILASYSGDDLTAVYRYFRSLAVEIPFSTARDNLIIAFEKNRQMFSLLTVSKNTASHRKLPARSHRGRGRGGIRYLPKEATMEQEQATPETYYAFCIRFVRLSGILFTRTSLETYEEVLSLVITDLHTLLSSGAEDALSFGLDTTENALLFVRIIAILIFSVHNVKKEPESQQYAEVVQRTVLIQNALTTSFELVGCILERCLGLHDAASTSYLPAFLVYIEWLASHVDVATDMGVDEKQLYARSFFWNNCISLMNKLILTGLVSVDVDDEICFSKMGNYEDGEAGNMLALWEDFELRGFSPLVPAHVILDFSRPDVAVGERGLCEKTTRVQRIITAGKSLAGNIRIGELKMFFDPSAKAFIMAMEPPAFEASMHEDLLPAKLAAESTVKLLSDDDDEEIVFKPASASKFSRITLAPSINESAQPVQISALDKIVNEGSLAVSSSGAAPFSDEIARLFQMSLSGWEAGGHQIAPSFVSTSAVNGFPQSMKMPSTSWANYGMIQSHESNIPMPVSLNQFSGQRSPVAVPGPLVEQESYLLGKLSNVSISQNGFDQVMHNGLRVLPNQMQDAVTSAANSMLIVTQGHLTAPKKNPVSRPVRHVGPPPGFNHVAVKPQENLGDVKRPQLPHIDDSMWSYNYQLPFPNDVSYKSNLIPVGSMFQNGAASGLRANDLVTSFPFTVGEANGAGTQIWQELDRNGPGQRYMEKRAQGSQLDGLMPDQQPADSFWSGRYAV